MKNNKGFSLVELIVVIAIMAILAAVAIPTFASFINKANEASDKQFIADLEYAIDIANATFEDEATLTKITVTGTEITAVEYTVGNEKVVLKKTNGTFGVDASTSTTDKDILEVVDGVISTMDWTYSFKSAQYKAGYELQTGEAEG